MCVTTGGCYVQRWTAVLWSHVRTGRRVRTSSTPTSASAAPASPAATVTRVGREGQSAHVYPFHCDQGRS